MIKLALIISAILALSILLLAINILLRRGKGEFRSQHIGENVKMRQCGIHCVQSMDARERMKNPHDVVQRERGT